MTPEHMELLIRRARPSDIYDLSHRAGLERELRLRMSTATSSLWTARAYLALCCVGVLLWVGASWSWIHSAGSGQVFEVVLHESRLSRPARVQDVAQFVPHLQRMVTPPVDFTRIRKVPLSVP